jgi:hypothetical protein
MRIYPISCRGATATERWAKVGLRQRGRRFAAIELFQIGDVYFVHDGNHRVSVARQNGHTHIEAYVTPVHTRVRFPPKSSQRIFF